MARRSGVGLRKGGSRRWRARSRLMTKDELKRHEEGAQRLSAAFGGEQVAPVAFTPAESSRIRGMLLGLGLRRRDELDVADPKTVELALSRARRTRSR